jgi:hypothetical protein
MAPAASLLVRVWEVRGLGWFGDFVLQFGAQSIDLGGEETILARICWSRRGFGAQEMGERGRAGKAGCRMGSRRKGGGDRSVDVFARSRLGTSGVARFSRAKSSSSTRALSLLFSVPHHLFAWRVLYLARWLTLIILALTRRHLCKPYAIGSPPLPAPRLRPDPAARRIAFAVAAAAPTRRRRTTRS